MTLEEIMGQNAELGSGLEEILGNANPQEPQVGFGEAGEDIAELLTELAQDESISDDELEMIAQAAEQLGPEFEPWLEEYLANKDMEVEDEGAEIFPGASEA